MALPASGAVQDRAVAHADFHARLWLHRDTAEPQDDKRLGDFVDQLRSAKAAKSQFCATAQHVLAHGRRRVPLPAPVEQSHPRFAGEHQLMAFGIGEADRLRSCPACVRFVDNQRQRRTPDLRKLEQADTLGQVMTQRHMAKRMIDQHAQQGGQYCLDRRGPSGDQVAQSRAPRQIRAIAIGFQFRQRACTGGFAPRAPGSLKGRLRFALRGRIAPQLLDIGMNDHLGSEPQAVRRQRFVNEHHDNQNAVIGARCRQIGQGAEQTAGSG